MREAKPLKAKALVYYVRMNKFLYPAEETDPRGRGLPAGIWVQTRVTGKLTIHCIVERRWVGGVSQSGIVFRLDPPIASSKTEDEWVDADWCAPLLTPQAD